ncbi:MAG TPA: hypothetical protein QF901_00060 [Gammaproteobacteria bacterium]|jgi:hypothetical protein|nr:hypothetical protein [Candidatus Hydrogenedentota bacterium]HJP34350.1 hypothetical protein [Gammaproteobacteria bacterium]
MERLASRICAAVALGAAALFAMNLANNPLDGRRAALVQDLGAIAPFEADYTVSGGNNYDLLRAGISNKRAIWNELIKPPPPPPRPVRVIPPPDFKKLLKSVTASKRTQTKVGGVIKKIKFRYAGTGRRGAMHEVGEVIQNCKILKLNEDSVTFGYKQGGKQYTHELPRERDGA